MKSQPPYPGRAPETLSARELAELVRFHNHAYFELNAPEIPDQLFDSLVRRLRVLDPKAAVLDELGSATQTSAGRVLHQTPMLSLGKCYGHDELLFWARAYEGELVASPKIDGVACAIRYDAQGHFKLAATRGDGRQGELILPRVTDMADVPSRLSQRLLDRFEGRAVEVRGEVYMRLSRFEVVSDRFANPRNVVAGAIKAKEQGGVPVSELSFFAYDLLGCEVGSEFEKVALLQEMGFHPPPSRPCQAHGADRVFADILAERDALDYEIDGVVYKMDDIAEQARLGSTAHHPRWAIAWKFQGDSGQSRLLSVEFSLSRTGTITPVALVEPVELSGAIVSRATLHNLSNLERLELKIGDLLLLTRRGGVIPHVEGNQGGGEGVIEVPSSCPSCGGPVSRLSSSRKVEGEEVITEILRCAAPERCPVVQREMLIHFTRALRMEGFGEKIVDGLLTLKLVADPAALFDLDRGKLLRLPRMGETLATRLLAQIEVARQVELGTLLVALGIDSLGKHAARLITSRWTLKEIRALSVEELAAVHSLGEMTAERVVEGLRDKAELLDRLEARLQVSRPAGERAGEGPLLGEVVVFTGTLQRSTRRDVQQRVVRLGGRAGSSVTATTTILVVGGDGLKAARPSSKLKKALAMQERGELTVLSEEQFYARIGE